MMKDSLRTLSTLNYSTKQSIVEFKMYEYKVGFF